jgi:hypothetical protein
MRCPHLLFQCLGFVQTHLLADALGGEHEVQVVHDLEILDGVV